MEKEPIKVPITKRKLAVIYLCLWLGAGLLAGLLHILVRPDYISIRTCIIGSFANLLGPWAGLFAAGWPNAGKMPQSPVTIVGLFLFVICVALVLMSMNSRRRWIQILSIIIFVPAIICWILLGFMELMIYAS
jgi:hypothetical protein